MFCTKCGKKLHDGDRFCGHCGAEVREAKHSKYDDVVFNPPFKIEAQKKTEQILKNTEKNQPEKKKEETVVFDWNLDGFPSLQPRKTEEVDFNWDSVLDKRNNSRQVKVEKIQPEQEFFFSQTSASYGRVDDTKEVPAVSDGINHWEADNRNKDETRTMFKPSEISQPTNSVEADKPSLSIEELEKEIFGETVGNQQSTEREETNFETVSEPTIIAEGLMKAVQNSEPEVTIPESSPYRKEDERFYTYNQKYDAFQELLEKERERLKNLEESYNIDKENLDYTWVGEVFPNLNKTAKEPELHQQQAINTQYDGTDEQTSNLSLNNKTQLGADLQNKSELTAALENQSDSSKTDSFKQIEEFRENSETEIKTENSSLNIHKPEVVSIGMPPLTMTIEAYADKENNTNTTSIIGSSTVSCADTKIDTTHNTDKAGFQSLGESQETVASACNKKEDSKQDNKKEAGKSEASPSKTKLRYSDVFPGSMGGDGSADIAAPSETGQKAQELEDKSAGEKKNNVDNNVERTDKPTREKPLNNSLFDDLEEEEPKKHTLTKIVIAFLIVLIIAEGTIIAAKLIAPQSGISLWASNMMLKVIDLFTGKESDDGQIDGDGDNSPYGNTEKDAYLENLITYASKNVETIGEIAYDPELKFGKLAGYSFEEIPEAGEFIDLNWYEDFEGNQVTYGQKMMEVLIRYYDSWQKGNNDKTLVGINKLSIGEIKTGEKGFYVLCRILYAGADGQEIEKTQTVYLAISDKTMIINEIKEDNL